MPHPMSDEELVAFLTADPPRTAKLATVRADGRPHVAPVWFALDTTTAGRRLARRRPGVQHRRRHSEREVAPAGTRGWPCASTTSGHPSPS